MAFCYYYIGQPTFAKKVQKLTSSTHCLLPSMTKPIGFNVGQCVGTRRLRLVAGLPGAMAFVRDRGSQEVVLGGTSKNNSCSISEEHLCSSILILTRSKLLLSEPLK